MSENTYIVSGEGFLSYTNIKSLCEHGTDEELKEAERKVSYLVEISQENLESLELGAELLEIDLENVEKKLKALKDIGATKKEVNKILGKDVAERVGKIISKRSELSYRTNMREKIREAQG